MEGVLSEGFLSVHRGCRVSKRYVGIHVCVCVYTLYVYII